MSELLKVLDMEHNEQAVWCEAPEHGNRQMGGSLADLAFRLRDEVCGEVVHFVERFKYEMAMRAVHKHTKDKGEFLIWVLTDSQPIHWIIATLIAGE